MWSDDYASPWSRAGIRDVRGRRAVVGRGALGILILHVLKDKPMHGYMIMEEIRKEFDGMYAPSPGAAYPRLEMLVDRGFIDQSVEGEKKVYSLTQEGLEFLQRNEERLKAVLERRSRHLRSWGRTHGISRRCRSILDLVSQNVDDLTDDQIRQIEAILHESMMRITSVIFPRGEVK